MNNDRFAKNFYQHLTTYKNTIKQSIDLHCIFHQHMKTFQPNLRIMKKLSKGSRRAFLEEEWIERVTIV